MDFYKIVRLLPVVLERRVQGAELKQRGMVLCGTYDLTVIGCLCLARFRGLKQARKCVWCQKTNKPFAGMPFLQVFVAEWWGWSLFEGKGLV